MIKTFPSFVIRILNFCFLQNNNDSLISNIFILICLPQLLKNGPKVIIRVITNCGIDINFLITFGEKYE